MGDSLNLTREIIGSPPSVHIGQLEHLPQLLDCEGGLQGTTPAHQMHSLNLTAG